MSSSSRAFRWGGGVSLTIGGRMELSKKLSKLKGSDARKVMRSAVMSGLRIGARRLKAKVPVGETKAVKSSVGVSFKKNPKDRAGVPVGKFGVNVGKKRKQMVKHAFAVMTGTMERKRKKSGGKTGRISSKKIMQQVAMAARSEILSAIRQKTDIGIRRIMAGQAVNDGGEFDRGVVQSEKQQARRVKLRAKKKAKRAKRAARLKKQVKRRAVRIAKKARRKFNKSAKRASRNIRRVAKKTRKSAIRTAKKVRKNLNKKLFGKPKRKRRK